MAVSLVKRPAVSLSKVTVCNVCTLGIGAPIFPDHFPNEVCECTEDVVRLR